MPNPEVTADSTGFHITAPTGQTLGLNGLVIVKKSVTVSYSQFTDGGSTAGTFMTGVVVPAGATFLYTAIRAITGFTGDTTAVITAGDGSDVDRYNTGTPSVFTTASTGVDAGVPSGTKYHTAAKEIKLTVTSGADFTSVAAGSVTLDFVWLM